MGEICVPLGILLILLGLINIRNKELTWHVDETMNSMNGVKSERTYNWEVMSTLRGYVLLFLGIGMLIYVFVR